MTPRQTTRTPKPFPIAFKLALGIFAAALLPTLFLTSIFLTARQDIDRRNIESYVRQVGERQRQMLTTEIARAKNTLQEFTATPDTNGILVGLLLDDIRTSPVFAQSTPQEVSGVMSDRLLNAGSAVFTDVRLLDPTGVVVAASQRDDDRTAIFEPQSVASRSVAFEEITRAQQAGTADQVIIVTQRGVPTIEIATIVKLRQTDNVVGYLVATLNTEGVIHPILNQGDSSLPAYSFLQSTNAIIISRAEDTPQARASLNNMAVQRAQRGESDFAFYSVQQDAGELGGYYATIQDTPLVLVTEMPVSAVLRQPAEYFGAWGFVLVVGLLALVGISAVFLYNRDLTAPIDQLRRAMQAVSVGNYDEPIPSVNRSDELGELSRTFVDMREQMRSIVMELQTRIDSRTRDVETTQEISRVAVSQRDLQQLMNDVVNLIVDRFANIYHAQIFLLDSDNHYAVLRSSTGDAGQKLLARGHRLAVGSISVIGQVTVQGEVIIAKDTAVSEVHRRNEFLPDTRAELAIPLRIGERIIGALDVQSRQNAAFEDEQVQVLQIMADQVAIAIENARLYQESTRRIRAVQEQSRVQTVRAWQDYMFDQRTHQLVRRAGHPTDIDLEPLRQQAVVTQEPAVGSVTARDTIPIAVPLRLREEIIGVVVWELPQQDYDHNKLQLAKDLVERLALGLDNTRLFEQSQNAAERERVVNDIAAKLAVQTNVDEILQLAVQEVGQALRAPQVSIRLNRSTLSQPTNGNGDGNAEAEDIP